MEEVDESQLILGGETGADSAGSEGSVPSLGVWDFARMILVLAAVVGAIYLVFYLLKRSAAGRYNSSSLIKHIGSQSLPGNKFVHLVEVGQQMFLVGTSDNGVNLISEITDKETLDELRLKVAQENEGARRSFSEMLGGMFGGSGTGGNGSGSSAGSGGSAGGSGYGAESGESGNPFSFIRGQRERLRNLK